MDHSGLIKSLQVPPGYRAPTELSDGDLRARALSREDLREDVRAFNAGIELIQRTRGGGWPTEPVTEEFNYVDLVWHYTKLQSALGRWLADSFPFTRPHYSNREM